MGICSLTVLKHNNQHIFVCDVPHKMKHVRVRIKLKMDPVVHSYDESDEMSSGCSVSACVLFRYYQIYGVFLTRYLEILYVFVCFVAVNFRAIKPEKIRKKIDKKMQREKKIYENLTRLLVYPNCIAATMYSYHTHSFPFYRTFLSCTAGGTIVIVISNGLG